jgi:hypothetical protein
MGARRRSAGFSLRRAGLLGLGTVSLFAALLYGAWRGMASAEAALPGAPSALAPQAAPLADA